MGNSPTAPGSGGVAPTTGVDLAAVEARLRAELHAQLQGELTAVRTMLAESNDANATVAQNVQQLVMAMHDLRDQRQKPQSFKPGRKAPSSSGWSDSHCPDGASGSDGDGSSEHDSSANESEHDDPDKPDIKNEPKKEPPSSPEPPDKSGADKSNSNREGDARRGAGAPGSPDDPPGGMIVDESPSKDLGFAKGKEPSVVESAPNTMDMDVFASVAAVNRWLKSIAPNLKGLAQSDAVWEFFRRFGDTVRSSQGIALRLKTIRSSLSGVPHLSNWLSQQSGVRCTRCWSVSWVPHWSLVERSVSCPRTVSVRMCFGMS